jgi:glycosyltransferase involved in cell wall biosynthesis
MRILLSCASLAPAYGGPAYSVSRLASALADGGVDVGLWAADQSAKTSVVFPAKSTVRRLVGSAAEAMDSFGAPNILHDNGIWWRHNHRLATLAYRHGIPRIVSTRGMLEPWAMRHKAGKKRLAWWLYQRRDLMGAACLHATSEREAQNVRALGLGAPVRMIPNGVDLPEPGEEGAWTKRQNRLAGAARRTALFLGRIYPVKGLPMLIEAWARLRPKGWILEIAGPDEGGHRSKLERAVAVAGLDDIVTFSGPMEGERKRATFMAADLLVLPSHSESFGMVVAEALAHGLPVLTTTGVPWPILPERGCGWWVDASTDGITEGLRQATALDAETLRAMGAKGRELVAAEFGWAGIAAQFITLYEQLVAERARAA